MENIFNKEFIFLYRGGKKTVIGYVNYYATLQEDGKYILQHNHEYYICREEYELEEGDFIGINYEDDGIPNCDYDLVDNGPDFLYKIVFKD